MDLMRENARDYRADIDGLRAVAVLSVLMHHVNSSILPGGFVGVDIFFVISGYLITSHIYKEMRAGSFTFQQFYKRRINRIAPALAAVVASCAVAGLFLLSPSDLKSFALTAAFSLVGLSNFFIWKEYGDYFAADAAEAVLLHTWTLGVEEQFYLIWPVALLCLSRAGARNLLTALLGLTFIAVAVSAYGAWFFPKASYYLLPTRLFELLIGCVLAVSGWNRPQWRLANLARSVTWMGYALILLALFGLNKESSFPGVNALYPCVGSACLIWAGAQSKPSGFLSTKVFTFVGQISYSLYLWHWPIIAYVNYLRIPVDWFVGSGIILASFLLAWLSWKYVEAPFRASGATLPFGRVFAWRLLFPFLSSLIAATLCLQFNGIPWRFDPSVGSFEAMAAAKPNELRSRCHSTISQYDREPDLECRLGLNKESADGILIGDSFANHFTAMIDELAKADRLTIIDYTMDGCLPIFGYSPTIRKDYAERCALRNTSLVKSLRERHYRYVVLAADWPVDESAGAAIENTLAQIVAAGSRPIIILGNQRMDGAASCPLRRIMFGLKQSCSTPQTEAPSYWSRVRAAFPDVRFVDPNEVICADRSCNPVIGETLLYRDNGHLNEVGSRTIGKILSARGRSLLGG